MVSCLLPRSSEKLLVALFLDHFGLNSKEGFGLVQIAGLVAGAVLILVGHIGKGRKKALQISMVKGFLSQT